MARINVPISVETKNAKQEIAAFNREMRSVEETSRLTVKALEMSGQHTEALTAKQKALTAMQCVVDRGGYCEKSYKKSKLFSFM